MLSGEITSLIQQGDILEARRSIDLYEAQSEFYDANGDIAKGREIFYYIKGKYFLAAHQLDSAEYMFRKELRDGEDLNNQIAGNKGLQEVFEQRKISDSIAKYATIAYELNDSAYSLSEMQNLQKFQASYNYNHNKYLIEKKQLETKILWLLLLFVIVVVVVLASYFVKRYCVYKNAALDYRLRNADISQRMRDMAQQNPAQIPTYDDWHQLMILVEGEIPTFYETLSPDKDHPISDFDYDVCLALRVQLSPVEISKLKQCTPAYITKIRKKLMRQVFNREDTSDVFDDEIAKIGKNREGIIRLPNLVKSFNRFIFR